MTTNMLVTTEYFAVTLSLFYFATSSDHAQLYCRLGTNQLFIATKKINFIVF